MNIPANATVRPIDSSIDAVYGPGDSLLGILDSQGNYKPFMLWDPTGTKALDPTKIDNSTISFGSVRVDAIASTKMATWGTNQANLMYMQGRLYEILQDDTDEVSLGFSSTYGFQETLSSGSVSLDLSIDNPDGTRVRAYFNNAVTGVVPSSGTDQTGIIPAAVGAAGLLFCVPVKLSAKLKRGTKLWYNFKLVYNGTGVNGHFRNHKQWNLDKEERMNVAQAVGPQPTDVTMAGVPSNGYTGYCFRPILIVGKTSRNVVIQYGDSINADDQSFPQITDGTGYAGITYRYLAQRVATVNLAQSSESYTNLNTGNRFALREYIGKNFGTVILDQLGVNESPGSTKAQFLAFFTAFKARFAGLGKPYGRTPLLPRATTTDNWTTVANQTIVTAAAPDTNEAMRSLAVCDFFVDINASVESSRGSGKWKPTAASTVTVAVTDGPDPTVQKTYTCATPIFTRDLVGATVGVAVAGTGLTPGQVYTVASDGLSAVIIGSAGNIGSTNLFIRPWNFDPVHPCVESELAVEQSASTWSQMQKYLV